MMAFLIVFILASAGRITAADAFAFTSVTPVHYLLIDREHTTRMITLLGPLSASGDGDDTDRNNRQNKSNDDDADDGEEDDSLFLESFRKAANSKLGSPIQPTQEEAVAAVRAENDFLNAMQDAKVEFAQAKEETGGDVNDAVDLVLGKIQKEEDLLEGLERMARETDDNKEKLGSDEEGKAGDADDVQKDSFQ